MIFLLLLSGRTVVAQHTTVPVDVSFPDDESLVLAWASNSNELYEVSFRTNLVQNQAVTLKNDILATPPVNELTIHLGSVPSAYFQTEVQAVLRDALPYELISPNNPTFVGTFCITNDVQFESLKNELGLAGRTFYFSTNAVIGLMAPETSSITGRYEMDYVRETENEVLVFYSHFSYYPYCMPAFNKDVLVVKTEHRNKPVRLIFRRMYYSYDQGTVLISPAWDASIDPSTLFPADPGGIFPITH